MRWPGPGWRRTALVSMLAVAALGAAVLGRVLLSSRAAYQRALATEKRALAEADPEPRTAGLRQAIVHYRRAARWYAPLNGYVTRSLDRLAAIARLTEEQGEASTALMAHRAIRRAIMGSRSFYTPHGDRLQAANRHIARLTTRLQAPRAGADRLAELERWHRKQLQRDLAPHLGWSVLALLGFLGWVGGAVGFLLGAITPQDRLVRRQALIWAGVVGASMLLWLLGLSQA